MKLGKYFLATTALTAVAQALIPLTIKGNRFIRPALDANDEGEVFSVIGVDYQPGGSSGYDDSSDSDVLSDEEVCLRDAFVLQQLGVNTIRVYTINPELNHDKCMSILNAAGIYVFLDVNAPGPNESIHRYDPTSSYNWWYVDRVFKVIDAFKGYPNLAGFFSGNEVINDGESAAVDPKYIRAVQRDMKEYIAKHANRTIPVGYSAADDKALRVATWDYLQCGDEDSRSDFFGLNSYEWCSGVSDWQSSGYGDLVTTFNDSSIPVFFSEYGCNKESPRTFDEVSEGLYSGLNQTFSGGLVYEYNQEVSNYGLVEIQSDGSVRLLQDFLNLQKQYNMIDLATVYESDVEEREAGNCSVKYIESLYTGFDANFTLPVQPGGLDELLVNGTSLQNRGKIVSLTKDTSKYKIYDVNGDEIKDTAVVFSSNNQINSPSGLQTGGTSSSSSAATSSSTSTTSASSETEDGAVAFAPGAGVLGFVLLIAVSLF